MGAYATHSKYVQSVLSHLHGRCVRKSTAYKNSPNCFPWWQVGL